ncbi:MAG: hypothetical protein WCK90_01960 [archaeon]
MKRILPITLAAVWIVISEFFRNEFVFKRYWIDHFAWLGLEFKTLPVNGILWIIWSVALAFVIFKLLTKFSFRETVLLSWLVAFVMMWLTMYNLQVLPLMLLLFAVPLSLIEVLVAAWIIEKVWGR